MINESVGNLKISGSGSSGGGVFNSVKISGSGKISGNVECNDFSISGSGKINGNIKTGDFKTSGSGKVSGKIEAEHIKISGSSHMSGEVKSEEISVSGSAHFDKDVSGSEIAISGSTHIGGSIRAEHVRVSGVIHVNGDCETEEFVTRGSFKIGGLLNGGSINIAVGGFCTAREIGGEKIEVREFPLGGIWHKFVSLFVSRNAGLTTDVIEGDDIFLEYTTAKIVRGNNVTIGKGCIIDTVEYKGKINIIDGGRVGNEVKVA